MDRRFYFVTGKGGVGKTTVAAAMALALSGRGRRVLLSVTNVKDGMPSLLNVASIGPEIMSVRDNLWAVRIDPARSVQEYGRMMLKSKLAYSALFGNRYAKSFFAALPGLYQWAILGKVWYHSMEESADGSQRFDCVIFDAPATGHGLEMLRVPKTIAEAVPAGPLRADAERAWNLLRDPDEAGIILVTLPEELPTQEALELSETLTGELEMPIAQVVLNQVWPEVFGDDARDMLSRLSDLRPNSAPTRALMSALRRAETEEALKRSVARLRDINAPLKTLPMLLTNRIQATDVARLSEFF